MSDYRPEQQLPEIPFDVAEWGDAQLPWPEGVFADVKEFETAAAKSDALPTSSPRPPKRA